MSSFTTSLIKIRHRTGIAALTDSYLGLGVLRHKLESAHAPCSSIYKFLEFSIAFIMISRAPFCKMASLNLEESPAILPKPQRACSTMKGLFYFTT